VSQKEKGRSETEEHVLVVFGQKTLLLEHYKDATMGSFSSIYPK